MFGFGSFNYLESQEQKDKEKRQGQKKNKLILSQSLYSSIDKTNKQIR